jgi:hypothetical protein
VNGEGTWQIDHPFRPEWDPLGMSGWGHVLNNGSWVALINFAQVPSSPGGINPENPVLDVWHGVWFPASFAPRQVGWEILAPIPDFDMSSVLLLSSPTEFVRARCLVFPGAVQIPVIPAPGPCAAFAIAAATVPAARRRHCGAPRP